jgi:hypothetical protein
MWALRSSGLSVFSVPLLPNTHVLRERWNRRRGASVALGMMGKPQRSCSMRSICSCSGARMCAYGPRGGEGAAAVCLKGPNAEFYGVINPRNGLPGTKLS